MDRDELESFWRHDQFLIENNSIIFRGERRKPTRNHQKIQSSGWNVDRTFRHIELRCFRCTKLLIYIYIYTYTHTHRKLLIYTGCPGRNVPDLRRMFLKLKYTDITQNTYIQSWTVTEIIAREVWKYGSYYTLIDYQIHIKTGWNMWFLKC